MMVIFGEFLEDVDMNSLNLNYPVGSSVQHPTADGVRHPCLYYNLTTVTLLTLKAPSSSAEDDILICFSKQMS